LPDYKIASALALSKNTTKSIKSFVTISGQVIEEDTGKPIIGALVRIAVPATNMREVRVSTDHTLYKTNTNDKGNFNIELPLNDAKYISVDVLAQGFRTAAGTYRGGGDVLLYKIAVEPDKAINLSIKLPKALYIAGTVKDDNGKIISGVKIHGQMVNKKGYGNIATTESDKFGKFELFDFPVKKNFDEAGVLLLKHQQFENVTISNLYEMSPDELSSIEIVMPKGWKITGTVLNSSGQVVPSAKVEATLGPGMIMKECLTDINGRFELVGLKKGPIILIAYLYGTNRKTEETLFFNGEDRDVTLKIQPVELTEGIKKIKLLGMEVADVTPSLQKLYNLSRGDAGVVILNPGTDYEHLGIGKLEIGNSFWIVGHKKIKDAKEMISEILRINGKPAPTTGGIIDEGHHGFVRIVYDMRKGTNTQYLKLTDENVRQLRNVGRQLGIPEDKLYEGVTTGDSLEEKERKNRFESGGKLIGLGKKMLEYAKKHEGQYPDGLEELKNSKDRSGVLPWVLKNVEYLGKGKTVNDSGDVVIAYDKTMLAENPQGSNALYNDGSVRFKKKGFFEKPRSNIEVLDIHFEPVAQGKNILHATIKNNSDTEQLFAIHIYTRSVDYGLQGVGWGTRFFKKIPPQRARRTRFAYKVQGPVTENTYIRVKFYNPATEKDYNYDKPFGVRLFEGSNLPKPEVKTITKQWTNEEMSEEIFKSFKNIQTLIKKKDYEQAWELFSEDYQKAEYQRRGYEAFKLHMEPENELNAAFHWDKKTFVALENKGDYLFCP